MNTGSLVTLLQSDREMILSALGRDRSPQAAQGTLQRALDRVSLRFAEQCDDRDLNDRAQMILRSLKSALTLMDSVSEVRVWEASVKSQDRPRFTPGTLGLMALGIVLQLSVMLGLMFSGGRLTGLLTLFEALVPAALGMAALFYAGFRAGDRRPVHSEDPVTRQEFLIDPEKVYHELHGMMQVADSALSEARGRAPAPEATSDAPLAQRQIELFANLLEGLYALEAQEAREMIEAIRFHLHTWGIEVRDMTDDSAAWFETLPAARPGTIRPALVKEGKIVKKGLAGR